jgi:hypothetical protein
MLFHATNGLGKLQTDLREVFPAGESERISSAKPFAVQPKHSRSRAALSRPPDGLMDERIPQSSFNSIRVKPALGHIRAIRDLAMRDTNSFERTWAREGSGAGREREMMSESEVRGIERRHSSRARILKSILGVPCREVCPDKGGHLPRGRFEV